MFNTDILINLNFTLKSKQESFTHVLIFNMATILKNLKLDSLGSECHHMHPNIVTSSYAAQSSPIYKKLSMGW